MTIESTLSTASVSNVSDFLQIVKSLLFWAALERTSLTEWNWKKNCSIKKFIMYKAQSINMN